MPFAGKFPPRSHGGDQGKARFANGVDLGEEARLPDRTATCVVQLPPVTTRGTLMFERLVELLVDKIKVPVGDLGPETTREQIDLNSLAIVELSVALEEDMGIIITERELKEIPTLGGIARLMEDRNTRT
ncbi:MAG: acyl carrier protein [Sciscionella sp.]